MTPLKAQAIQIALLGDWPNAVTINQQILAEEPDDIDTLNRLAFAFLSLGNTKQAKLLYEKVLQLDMKNPIALRNLKRLGDVNAKPLNNNIQLNNLFIEEPGKTKVIELLNIADKKILSRLRSGEKLMLRIKRNKIFALDCENQFVGMLPDDLAQRLIRFINGGNQYDAYVRTIDNNQVCIFIREIKRMKKYRHQPSFVSTDKSKFSLENNGLSSKSVDSKSGKSVTHHFDRTEEASL